jgi:hypothetical protein
MGVDALDSCHAIYTFPERLTFKKSQTTPSNKVYFSNPQSPKIQANKTPALYGNLQRTSKHLPFMAVRSDLRPQA